MSVTVAQNAILSRFQDMPNRPPLAYPNGTIVDELPRIVLQVTSPSQRTATLKGQTEGDAEIVARIEVEANTFDTEATVIFDAIVAHFAVGTRFDGVSIVDAPNPRPRFTRDGVYHIPVIIRGRYDF